MARCDFFNDEAFALFGMSRQKGRFGNTIHDHLTRHGYRLYPIHPEAGEVQGVQAFRTVSDLPERVRGAIICVPPQAAQEIVARLGEAGIERVFLQQGSESPEVLDLCRARGLTTYYKSCAILNSRPTGLHAVHAFFARLFGLFARRQEPAPVALEKKP